MTFGKYDQDGAYHWRGAEPTWFGAYQPQLDANYVVACRLLFATPRDTCTNVRVLDLGCGDGVLLPRLARGGLKPIGMDDDEEGLRCAKRMITPLSAKGILISRASGYSLPLKSASISAVTAIEVLEHFENPDTLLAEVRRVLEPGGVLVLTTPRRNADGKLRSNLHFREYAAEELRNSLSIYFNQVEVVGFAPLWIKMLYQRSRLPGRALVKFVSRFVFNPYTRLIRTKIDERCDSLAAVARV